MAISGCASYYPAADPLPPSASVCKSPLSPGATAGKPPATGPRLGSGGDDSRASATSEVPALTAVFGIRKASCCIALALPRIGEVGAPAEAVAAKYSACPVSLHLRRRTFHRFQREGGQAQGNEEDTGADVSAGVRKMPQVSRSARRAFSPLFERRGVKLKSGVGCVFTI